jgi:hypothetical protein
VLKEFVVISTKINIRTGENMKSILVIVIFFGIASISRAEFNLGRQGYGNKVVIQDVISEYNQCDITFSTLKPDQDYFQQICLASVAFANAMTKINVDGDSLPVGDVAVTKTSIRDCYRKARYSAASQCDFSEIRGNTGRLFADQRSQATTDDVADWILVNTNLASQNFDHVTLSAAAKMTARMIGTYNYMATGFSTAENLQSSGATVGSDVYYLAPPSVVCNKKGALHLRTQFNLQSSRFEVTKVDNATFCR